jgi:hypothetical protein
VHDRLAAAHGDFLQGAVTGRFGGGDRLQIALSWHKDGRGVHLLSPPLTRGGDWTLERLSEVSQDEALSAGDIDGDGRIDLLLGTVWLRNEAGGFKLHRLSDDPRPPDRNRLVDIDGDGRLDAVVGFEAISSEGEIVWFAQGSDPYAPWVRHRVGTLIGPMSLDVGDVNGDGRPDIVVGEHNLTRPAEARLVLFENTDGRGGAWTMRVLAVGDEHHDGAQLVDIDGDGDLDVVSIGWGHSRVLWFENPAKGCR